MAGVKEGGLICGWWGGWKCVARGGLGNIASGGSGDGGCAKLDYLERGERLGRIPSPIRWTSPPWHVWGGVFVKELNRA